MKGFLVIFCYTHRPCPVIIREASSQQEMGAGAETHNQTLSGTKSKREVSIVSLSQKRGWKDCRSQREDTMRTCPTEASEAHMGSQRLSRQACGLCGSVLGPPCMFSLASCGSRVSLTLFLLFSFSWVALSSLGVGAFAFSYCILFHPCVFGCCLLEACSFLMGDRGGVKMGDREDVGGSWEE